MLRETLQPPRGAPKKRPPRPTAGHPLTPPRPLEEKGASVRRHRRLGYNTRRRALRSPPRPLEEKGVSVRRPANRLTPPKAPMQGDPVRRERRSADELLPRRVPRLNSPCGISVNSSCKQSRVRRQSAELGCGVACGVSLRS